MVSVVAILLKRDTSTRGKNPPQGGGSTRGTRPPQGGTQHRGGAAGGHHTAGGTSTQGGPSHPPTLAFRTIMIMPTSAAYIHIHTHTSILSLCVCVCDSMCTYTFILAACSSQALLACMLGNTNTLRLLRTPPAPGPNHNMEQFLKCLPPRHAKLTFTYPARLSSNAPFPFLKKILENPTP